MIFDEIQNKRIMVVGDFMLDRLLIGRVERIAPEAPVPVFLPETIQDNLGGTGNVANNLRDMMADVIFMSILGGGAVGKTSLALINEMDFFDVDVIVDENRQTPLKTRYYSNSHYVFRVDIECPEWLDETTDRELIDKVSNRLAAGDIDAVIVEDYDKGTVTPQLIAFLRDNRPENVLLIADPKRQNLKSFFKYDALVPNLKELQSVYGSNVDIGKVREKMGLQALCVTCGNEGTILATAGEVTRYAVKPVTISDVCGAGDTFVAALTLTRACGKDWPECVIMANDAARVVVQKPGVCTCSLVELQKVYSGTDGEATK